MNLKEILDFVNFNVNKTQEGNSVSANEFNTLLSVFNTQMFEDEVAAVEMQAKAQGKDVYGMMYSRSTLRPFRIKADITTLEGNADLPEDYSHYISFIAKFKSQERKIEVVSEEDMNTKRSSIIENTASISPIVVIYSDTMSFLPKTIGSVDPIEMVYLKTPATPYYDECLVSASGRMLYMPATSYITSAVGAPTIANLYASGGSVIQYGVEHPGWTYTPGGPTVTYTSKTVELEWPVGMHMTMIKHLLSAVSLNMRISTQTPNK